MKKKEEYKELTKEEEIASIIYSCITTADQIEKKYGNLQNNNPIIYLINSLSDLDFPILKDHELITRKGGARYVMNDVSSYRKAKEYDVKEVKTLDDLFKRYGCKTKEDIIKLINHVYCIRENKSMSKDQIIKEVLMAYQTYYKNNISVDTWPKEKEIYNDYISNITNQNIPDNSYMTSKSDIGSLNNSGSWSLTINHLRYRDTKMMIIADGNGEIENENAAYTFCDLMNEWFWKSNPFSNNYKEKLKIAIKEINEKIKSDHKTYTSASVIIILPTTTYICSIGNTRVYIGKKGKLTRIERKETLYDDIKENKKEITDIIYKEEYAKKIPVDVIGHSLRKNKELKPEITVIYEPVESVLAVSSAIYNSLDDNHLSQAMKENSEEIIDTIYSENGIHKSSAVALYQRKKVKKLTIRKKAKQYIKQYK